MEPAVGFSLFIVVEAYDPTMLVYLQIALPMTILWTSLVPS